MVETTYHPEWQISRINFILSKYPKEFFLGKTILELAPYNGYIGAYFQSIGAKVHSIEGRQENMDKIRANYPELSVELNNLDTPDWKWGKWDIIINFGLFYHLEKFHKEHLENCINNCDLMFFESVIFDSNEPTLYFDSEFGSDQSLTDIGGTPSTSYVEKIFIDNKVKYTKYTDSKLNGGWHHYDWTDTDSKQLNKFARRFWIVKNNN
jgi:hypothetical protein